MQNPVEDRNDSSMLLSRNSSPADQIIMATNDSQILEKYLAESSVQEPKSSTKPVYVIIKNEPLAENTAKLHHADNSPPKCTEQNNGNNTIKEEARPFAQTNESFKVGIYAAKHPDVILTSRQQDKVRNVILRKMIKQAECDIEPKFIRIKFKPGLLALTCSNKETAEWIKTAIKGIEPWEWEGAKLKIIDDHELPNVNIAIAIFPYSKADNTSEILKFISVQNEGLDVGKWEVLERINCTLRSAVRLKLSLDDTSCEYLEKNNFKVSYKFSEITIIPLKERTLSKQKEMFRQSGEDVQDEFLAREYELHQGRGSHQKEFSEGQLEFDQSASKSSQEEDLESSRGESRSSHEEFFEGELEFSQGASRSPQEEFEAGDIESPQNVDVKGFQKDFLAYPQQAYWTAENRGQDFENLFSPREVDYRRDSLKREVRNSGHDSHKKHSSIESDSTQRVRYLKNESSVREVVYHQRVRDYRRKSPTMVIKYSHKGRHSRRESPKRLRDNRKHSLAREGRYRRIGKSPTRKVIYHQRRRHSSKESSTREVEYSQSKRDCRKWPATRESDNNKRLRYLQRESPAREVDYHQRGRDSRKEIRTRDVNHRQKGEHFRKRLSISETNGTHREPDFRIKTWRRDFDYYRGF